MRKIKVIGDREEFTYNKNGISAEIRYIRWIEYIDEYSQYYFIDGRDDEKYKQTTTLNNKGDHFYHSVYIKSSLFDNFYSYMADINETEEQPFLFTDLRRDENFKNLIENIDQFLKAKRKPFLQLYTDKLIADFEKEGVFPKFNENNTWDHYRRIELVEIIRELYQIEPRFFISLNTEQKKIFTHFLNLILDSGEKDKILDILAQIINLDSSELDELQEILKTTTLSAIIRTIRLIEDRYKAKTQLYELVFNPKFETNEPDHVQKFVEKHYWLFGEQYHLVSAAEPKFEEALRRFIYLLRGEKEKVSINHTDKNKEMDIFMVRQLAHDDLIHNVVVELKNPKVKLGEKELSQVKKYMRVILNQPAFNANNMFWEFILVGNEFDTTGFLKTEIANNKSKGEKSLVFEVNNYKIYVKKWSEIFTEFELRHKFLLDKLELQREKIIVEESTANEVIENLDGNIALQPEAVSIP